MPRKIYQPGRKEKQMCKEKKEGQPGCPKSVTPMEAEILQLLRGLRPELRKEALRLLQELEKGGKDHGAPPQPR